MRRAVAGVGGGRSGGVGRFRGLCACLLVFFLCVCVSGSGRKGVRGEQVWWWCCGSWLAAESAAGWMCVADVRLAGIASTGRCACSGAS